MYVDREPSTVQIRVLGPVELALDGRTVALPPLEGGLLAILVAYGGRTVSTDRLLDTLWAPPVPTSGRNRVQAVVSSLRRAVRTADLVVTTAPGYRLCEDAGVVDAARFADLVRDARAHVGAGEAAAAALAYRAALGLWRGEAFDNAVAARDPLVRAESARLNESRLVAVEELMDVELALGHHRDISAELIALVATHPHRENLRRQLMLGLVGNGQATEALLVYREGYLLLRDEFGTEPGPELQSLHREILAGSPPVSRPAPAGPAPEPLGAASRSWPLPNQLPMTIRDFVGRLKEMDTITHALCRPASAPCPAVIAITGIGGVGKTTLAVHAARRALGDFPDGVLYAELRGMSAAPVEPRSALAAFLRALGVHPEAVPNDADERLGLFRSVTAGRRLLVVLDDAADEAQIRPLLPAGGGCAAIVTARTDLSGLDGADVIALDGLTITEGAELLGAIAGAGRVAVAPLDGERVVRICAGLPLALRIIGVRLASRPGLTVARLAERLTDESLRLGELTAGDRSVRSTFALSYRRLEPRAAALLRLFSVHPGPDIGLAAVAALGAMSAAEARELVGELCAVHLVTEDEVVGDRYRVHDLIHVYAAERAAAEDVEGADAALRRLVDWYIDRTVTGRAVLTGREWPPAAPARRPAQPACFVSHPDVITWFTGEHATTHALLHEANRRGWHDATWRLAYGLHTLHLTSHTVDGWTSAVELGVAAAVALGDGAAEIRTRCDLGAAYYMLDRLADAEAQWQEALRRCDVLGEAAESARCHDNLGLLYHQRGELARAVDHHLLALAVPTYVADPSSAAAVHLHVAIVRADQGRYDESQASFDSALRHAIVAGNRFLECHVHHNAAELQRMRGRHHQARAHAESEILIARAANLALREARGLELLGDCDVETDAARARRSWLAAMVIYDRINHPAGAALRARLDVLP